MKDQFSNIKWEFISRLWNNNLSDEELSEFTNEEVNSSLTEYYNIRRAASSLQFRDEEKVDVDVAWDSVKDRAGSGYVRPLWKNVFKYVAVIAPLLICATFLWNYLPTDEVVVKDEAISILPGHRRAELVLASGEKIAIGEGYKSFEMNQQGAKVIGDSVSGKLRYEKTDLGKNTEVLYNTLKIPKGGEFYLELADGSSVWLNSESVIKYPVSFGGNKRDVYLEGEAYFNIAHDKTKPFYVHTGDVKVKVLGTRFNVCAYPEEVNYHTTLVQGAVNVEKGNSNIILKPSFQYSLNKQTGVSEVKRVDTDIYTSWIDGKFYFKGFKFEDVVRKLERWYDFEMFYLNEEVKQMRFRGVINKHEPIEKMLRKLEKTTDIRFRIKGKTIIVEKVHK